MEVNLKLNKDEGDLLHDAGMYKRLIGRLLFLAISKPDITYSVHRLSQCLSLDSLKGIDDKDCSFHLNPLCISKPLQM